MPKPRSHRSWRRPGPRTPSPSREEAQKQAGVIIENAKQEAQEEKRRQLEAMHDQVMELSVALASRILEREIKPEDHQKLMEEFLSEVK